MQLLTTIIRLLFFRISRLELLRLDRKHFFAGVVGTWLVGMGRYWDDPGASVLQHLGLGSVIYIFVLSAVLWLLVMPLLVPGWSYFKVLCFISLTSFPAIFYAIPVERFTCLQTANTINVWFLAIVATWRMALLFFFLKRFTQLSSNYITVIGLLPICAIITSLFALNLHRVVFDIMGGMRNPTPHDGAYMVLMLLTVLSSVLFLPLLAGYCVGIWTRRKKLKEN